MSESTLAEITGQIRETMEAVSATREEALRQCRATIQAASRTIRALHRGEFSEADAWMERARESAEAICRLRECQPSVYYSGYVHDAQKEYAEAVLAGCLLRDRAYVTPEDLGVEPAAYLNGLAEAGSEGRRYVLDRLRAGDMAEADRVLAAMDDIYYELIACDFADAVTGGLRRTTDAYRAVLERTRGDLVVSAQQRALQDALQQCGGEH